MATAAEIVVLIDTAIEAIATDGVASLTIGGRTITYHRPEELLKLRKYYSGLDGDVDRAAEASPSFRRFGFYPRRPSS